MDQVKAREIAHALYRSYGDKAEVLAAQRETQYKDAGDTGEATYWRTIRGSIRQMRGANQS